MGEDGRAVAFQMLVEAQAKASFGQHTSKRCLAHFQGITPHVVAVQFDQVEGVEEYAPVSALVTGAKTVGPSPSKCSLKRRPRPALASILRSVALRTSRGSRRRSSRFSSIMLLCQSQPRTQQDFDRFQCAFIGLIQGP